MSVAIVLGQLEQNRRTVRRFLIVAIGLIFIEAMLACQSEDDDATSDDDTDDIRHISTTGNWTQVSVIATHSCGLGDNGSVVCWGSPDNPSMLDVVVGPFVQISTHLDQVCGVTEQGDIECWGCDDEEDDSQCEDAPPGYPGKFIWTAAGNDFSAGLMDTGTLLAWGCPGSGSGAICSQTPVEGYSTMIDANYVLCGIHDDGSIQCVGSNAIASDPGFVQMDIRYANDVCAVGVDGKAYCIAWSLNEQAWVPSDMAQDMPNEDVTQVSVYRDYACTILALDGTVTCWGDFGDRGSEVPDGSFEQISVGSWHSCGVRTDGYVECWGCPGGDDYCVPP